METLKYLIKLTPHHKFFFGGERTFGDKNKSNYLVKSNDFPQQTAVLGLVRFQLLRESNFFDKAKNHIKPAHKKEVEQLIGKGSFDVGNVFEFGKIGSISTLFIAKEEADKTQYYFPANNEYQEYQIKNTKEKKRVFLELEEIDKKKQLYSLKYHDLNKEIQPYSPKEGVQPYYFSKDSTDFLKPDDLFTDHKQTGIRKNYKGQTDENAYYIQYFKKFQQKAKERYSFAFILEVDKTVDPNTFNQEMVVLGGEQQTFKMTCTKASKDFKELLPAYKPSLKKDKVVLVSDAYVSINKGIDGCDFAIADTVDFRFLKTTVETTENYADMERNNDIKTKKVSKSEKFNLYRKGSVFYGDTAKIVTAFENQNFIKLGYNQFEIIKKKGNE